MNKPACVLAMAALLLLSACGPFRRLRTRPSAADSAAVVVMPGPDSGIVRADSGRPLGPFPDSLFAGSPADTPLVIDDSKMAMEWWMIPLAYSTFSGKAKARFESAAENRDFTLTVRIESGRRIWMSVVGSALGISMEAMRVLLTPDSMIAINRIDREVIRAPFSEIGTLFPVQGDFATLEAVLVGAKLPAAPQLHFVGLDATGSEYIVSGATPRGEQLVIYRRSDSLMMRQRLRESGSWIELSYDNYVAGRTPAFAAKRLVRMEDSLGIQTLSLEFTSFSFDEAVDLSFTVPEKYKQR